MKNLQTHTHSPTLPSALLWVLVVSLVLCKIFTTRLFSTCSAAQPFWSTRWLWANKPSPGRNIFFHPRSSSSYVVDLHFYHRHDCLLLLPFVFFFSSPVFPLPLPYFRRVPPRVLLVLLLFDFFFLFFLIVVKISSSFPGRLCKHWPTKTESLLLLLFSLVKTSVPLTIARFRSTVCLLFPNRSSHTHCQSVLFHSIFALLPALFFPIRTVFMPWFWY